MDENHIPVAAWPPNFGRSREFRSPLDGQGVWQLRGGVRSRLDNSPLAAFDDAIDDLSEQCDEAGYEFVREFRATGFSAEFWRAKRWTSTTTTWPWFAFVDLDCGPVMEVWIATPPDYLDLLGDVASITMALDATAGKKGGR